MYEHSFVKIAKNGINISLFFAPKIQKIVGKNCRKDDFK